MNLSHLNHLNTAEDLVTTYAAQRAGFIALALEKNRRATPYVEQARILQAALTNLSSASDLLFRPELQPALLAASGVSDKAANHLQSEDKAEAIKGLIEQFLLPAGAAWVDEVVYRFLLTRGDTLGGSMRNLCGAVAQQQFNGALIATLRL